jgi:hypothetical protein
MPCSRWNEEADIRHQSALDAGSIWEHGGNIIAAEAREA